MMKTISTTKRPIKDKKNHKIKKTKKTLKYKLNLIFLCNFYLINKINNGSKIKRREQEQKCEKG